MTPFDSFWSKVAKTAGCWEWQAAKKPDGYGYFNYDGQTRGAHRVAWMLTNGPIPDGLKVCHHCDNPPCVRPDHLFLGTNRDNALDAAAKGRLGAATRAKTHCRNGHPYAGDNLLQYPTARRCLTCRRAAKNLLRRQRRLLDTSRPIRHSWFREAMREADGHTSWSHTATCLRCFRTKTTRIAGFPCYPRPAAGEAGR